MKVFVAGAGTCFAEALLPALCADVAIEAVTGIDVVAPRFRHPKFRTLELDFRQPPAEAAMQGHDALVYLASNTPSDAETSAEALALAVRQAHKLFGAARAADLRRLVHLSSAAVYGSAVHVSENAPLRPLAGFAYAEYQARLEQLLAIDFPKCVRLRPHVIVGPHAHPMVKRFLRQPFYPQAQQAQPLFQCVHEDDLAAAVLLCLKGDARGAYNIATEDAVSLRDALRARFGKSFGVKASTAQWGLGLAHRFPRFRIDPVWVDRASHTLLINCRRAIIELGWRPRFTTRAALAAT